MARQSPQVDYRLPEVDFRLPQWALVSDCLRGQQSVKQKATAYLPMPNASDTSVENRQRYKAYLERAVFYNATARTANGLVGQIFRKDPVVEVPALMEPLTADADGKGVTLTQQASNAVLYALAYGRGGLLVDYPKVDGQTSRKQLLDGHIRANVLLIHPQNIINWRVDRIGAKATLSLVVIEETFTREDDGFKQEVEDQWRVLRLIDGAYVQQVWRRDQNAENEFILIEQLFPVDSTGNFLTEIPFTFFGVRNNDPEVDDPPLYDLAVLNIGHYRNSADYEEACYITGQPTYCFAGLTEQWFKNVLQGSVRIGSPGGVFLPVGGSASILQPSANSMPKEAMEHKERQMVALGAKLVEDKQVQRTATEANLEEASETSVLSNIAKNVSSAYVTALQWAAAFMGAPDETLSFELTSTFEITRLDPNALAQLIAAWQGGAITYEEMRWNLVRADIAYLDDEEAKTQSETDPLLAMAQPAQEVMQQDE